MKRKSMINIDKLGRDVQEDEDHYNKLKIVFIYYNWKNMLLSIDFWDASCIVITPQPLLLGNEAEDFLISREGGDVWNVGVLKL